MAETLLRIIMEGQDNASQALGKVGGALSSLGGVAGGVALGGAGLAAGAIAGIGAASLSMATDIETATADMQSALGLTAEEADKFGGIATSVFGNNFADSVTGAGEAVIAVRQQLKSLTDDELQDATENALRFTDVFGEDLDGSLNAANTLMEKFGLTQGEAFDFMTEGFQRGLNSSGDFLDTISEYGVLFSQAGGDAGQFFSLMESGLQGGALGTDKAADAFKEFQIRFLEGGDDVEEAFGLMGESHQEWIDAVSNGSETTASSFGDVLGMIASIEDPIKRNEVGVALLGTQFEDMGADAIAAMNLTQTSMSDTEGAVDSLDAKYNTLGSAMEGLKRQALVALAPIGGILLEGINAAMPFIESAVGWFTETAVPIIEDFAIKAGEWIADLWEGAQPILENFSDQWDQNIGPAMLMVRDAMDRISEAMGLGNSEISSINIVLGALEGILSAVITAVQLGAIAFQGLAWGVEKVSDAISIASDLFDQFGQITSAVGDKIPDWLKPGSPPPLANALSDISRELTRMPDLGASFGFGGAPAIAGMGSGSTFNITINANNAAGGREAATAFMEQMRSRGQVIS